MNWWDKGRATAIKHTPHEEFKADVHSIKDLDELYTVEEVAKYFKVTEGTIYKWKMNGLLENTPQGRDLRFTAKQIAECKHRRENKWQKTKRKEQLEKVSG